MRKMVSIAQDNPADVLQPLLISFLGKKDMTHEFDGKKYEIASTHQKEWGTKLIAELGLTGSEHILDLGCGDGVLTSQIAELVPDGDVLGIDASQGMIDAALPKERYNLHFRKMDINDLDFENKFNLVFSNATLHWVADHQRLLQNSSRALRAGGCIRFQFAGDGNCENFIAVVRKAIALEEFRIYFAGFEWPWHMPAVDEYERLVGSSGFRNVRVWGENADRFFPDSEAMIKWIEQPSLVPFLVHITDPAKDSFRDFVVSSMIDRTKQEDGRYFETFRRINVSASK
jgi:trans-aconitate 2-methyltransferase